MEHFEADCLASFTAVQRMTLILETELEFYKSTRILSFASRRVKSCPAAEISASERRAAPT